MLRVALVAALAALGSGPVLADGFAGRWNARITDVDGPFRAAGFEVTPKQGGLAVVVVWRFGSALPARTVEEKEGVLRFEREETPGKVDRFEARVSGDALTGEVLLADGSVRHFEGKRAPELASTKTAQWGKAAPVFDGKSLAGWSLRDPQAKMGWAVVDGTLAVVEPKGNADLVTDAKFQDLKVHLEFNLEPGSNSGVYLRGRYEIQILDDKSKATEEHGCGALYSRIAPKIDATRPAGEWQSFDLTLVGRRLTVVLNGQTVVDGATVPGITGGAENPFEGEPGPLMLQGDHGKVRFRSIVVTPAR